MGERENSRSQLSLPATFSAGDLLALALFSAASLKRTIDWAVRFTIREVKLHD
jgi:hypothetical protein